MWLGWFALSPALGLPTLATAGMVNRPVASHENPDYWAGWLLLLVGLAIAVGTYFFVTSRLVRAREGYGLIYGLGLWLVAGAIVMPILAWAAPSFPPPPPLPPGIPPPPQAGDPMHANFMMLDLSGWAPVSAAVAWLSFGAVLGAVSFWGARERA